VVINKLKFFSYQWPMAYRYGSGPERTGGMLSSRPKKCWHAIPAHTVSPRALTGPNPNTNPTGVLTRNSN